MARNGFAGFLGTLGRGAVKVGGSLLLLYAGYVVGTWRSHDGECKGEERYLRLPGTAQLPPSTFVTLLRRARVDKCSPASLDQVAMVADGNYVKEISNVLKPVETDWLRMVAYDISLAKTDLPRLDSALKSDQWVVRVGNPLDRNATYALANELSKENRDLRVTVSERDGKVIALTQKTDLNRAFSVQDRILAVTGVTPSIVLHTQVWAGKYVCGMPGPDVDDSMILAAIAARTSDTGAADDGEVVTILPYGQTTSLPTRSEPDSSVDNVNGHIRRGASVRIKGSTVSALGARWYDVECSEDDVECRGEGHHWFSSLQSNRPSREEAVQTDDDEKTDTSSDQAGTSVAKGGNRAVKL